MERERERGEERRGEERREKRRTTSRPQLAALVSFVLSPSYLSFIPIRSSRTCTRARARAPYREMIESEWEKESEETLSTDRPRRSHRLGEVLVEELNRRF
jgi:hypothetical protein